MTAGGKGLRSQVVSLRQPSREQLSEALIRLAPAAIVGSRKAPLARPGLYGELVKAPRTDFGLRVKPPTNANEWQSKPFGHVVSEFSPAVLYQSQLRAITFFNRITEWGHGGPAHVALATGAGTRVAGRGERLRPLTCSCPKCLAPIDGALLSESCLDRCKQEGIDAVRCTASTFRTPPVGWVVILHCDNRS